jgi:hypothetical protein
MATRTNSLQPAEAETRLVEVRLEAGTPRVEVQLGAEMHLSELLAAFRMGMSRQA